MDARPVRLRLYASIGFLSLCLALLTACGGTRHPTLIVAGSTSVQPYAELLAEEYSLLYPGNEVDIQGGGSSAGVTAVESGAADIGMSSRALKESELGMWSVEIAKDGLAIIIHPDNPIDSLSADQLRGIYAATITNWIELGGPDARIHVFAREEGSGTRSAFEELVMQGTFITPKAIVQDSNGAVRQLISNDRYSIGFISLGLVDTTVKALKMDGVAATWENVVNGTYSLYRPFLFVTSGDPSEQSGHFIDFTLSAIGQELLINEGLIPHQGIIAERMENSE